MDVEQRSGQFYNSEISASFIGVHSNNNRQMNHNQKQKFQKSRKPERNPNRTSRRTPCLEVLPKIESNKSHSPDMISLLNNPKSQSSNNNSSTMINDKSFVNLPNSEAFSANNVQEWLQIPSRTENFNSSQSNLSSESEDLLTRTGELSDLTSVTSSEWGDDVCEFDKKESRRVNQMFEEIEWMLFNDSSSSLRSGSNKRDQSSSSYSERSGINSGPTHLKHECSEWTNQFPHFRLVGHQISLPQEQGYMFYESDASGSVTPKNSPRILITNSPVNSEFMVPKSISETTDVEKMSMVGYSIRLDTIESDQSTEEVDLLSSQEEVFATDGEIVEIIAIDYKMDDEDFNLVSQKKLRSHKSLFRSHKGFPPITPNAVMRDAVLTAVFDNLWSQVVEWILPLLSKVYQSLASRDMLVMGSSESSQSINIVIPDLYKGHKPLSQLTTASLINLDNILKVSSKTLQFREKSYLQSIPEQVQSTTPNPKANIGTARDPLGLMNYPRKPNKHLQTDRSQTPMSIHESSFLLDKEYKRSSFINHSRFLNSSNAEHLSPLQCLRGKALYNCQSPDMISRCGTLPPINSRHQPNSQHRSTGSRVGSAQIQNNLSQNISIGAASITNHLLINSDFTNTRPGTSQTARSDQTAGQRTSTPTASRRSVNLNIHGSSIPMNSLGVKGSDEVTYETLKTNSKKFYNNPGTGATKRNKALSNFVK